MYRDAFCGERGPRTIFTVQVCEGYHIAPFSRFPDEAEVLLRPLSRFNIISVADPSTPTLRGTINDPTSLKGARGVVVRGSYAYVAAEAYDSITRRLEHLKEGGHDKVDRIGAELQLLLGGNDLSVTVSGREQRSSLASRAPS